MSSPPIRPARRRKTLAGMAISKARTCTFSLRRNNSRVKARRHAVPVAQKAEALLCKTMGIVKDGELVTAQVLEDFASRFRGQIPDQALAAFRALFKLDDESVTGRCWPKAVKLPWTWRRLALLPAPDVDLFIPEPAQSPC
jgi:hypothetical protein